MFYIFRRFLSLLRGVNMTSGKRKERERTPKTRIVFAICVVAILFGAFAVVVWDVNGSSFDLTGRVIMLDKTDSMDHDSRSDIVKTDIGSVPVHSLIVVKILNDDEKNDLQVGDVVEYTSNGESITHRIIGIDYGNGLCYTQGDNSPSADPPRQLSEINGKVIGVSQPLGTVATFIQNNPVLTVVIVVLFLILLDALGYIYKGFKDGKEDRKSEKGEKA